MAKPKFIRLAETIHKHEKKRVVSVTVTPTITDCSGRLWITDLQLQEGSALSGYTPHTEVMLRKFREDGAIKASCLVQRRGAVKGNGYPVQPRKNLRAFGRPHLSQIRYGGGISETLPGRGLELSRNVQSKFTQNLIHSFTCFNRRSYR